VITTRNVHLVLSTVILITIWGIAATPGFAAPILIDENQNDVVPLPAGTQTGTLVLLENGEMSDIVAFGPILGILFAEMFSDLEPGEPNPDAADSVNLNLITLVPPVVRIEEDPSGATPWTPAAGQPGFNAGMALTYSIMSDPPEPVPEPGSFTLLALGTVGLLGYAWRRRGSRPLRDIWKVAEWAVNRVQERFLASLYPLFNGARSLLFTEGQSTMIMTRKAHFLLPALVLIAMGGMAPARGFAAPITLYEDMPNGDLPKGVQKGTVVLCDQLGMDANGNLTCLEPPPGGFAPPGYSDAITFFTRNAGTPNEATGIQFVSDPGEGGHVPVMPGVDLFLQESAADANGFEVTRYAPMLGQPGYFIDPATGNPFTYDLVSDTPNQMEPPDIPEPSSLTLLGLGTLGLLGYGWRQRKLLRRKH
jgi:hypothetical protein